MHKLLKNLYESLNIQTDYMDYQCLNMVSIQILDKNNVESFDLKLVLTFITKLNEFEIVEIDKEKNVSMELHMLHIPLMPPTAFPVDYIFYDEKLYVLKIHKSVKYSEPSPDVAYNTLNKYMQNGRINIKKLSIINTLLNNKLYTNLSDSNANDYIENYLKKGILPKHHKTEKEIQENVRMAMYRKYGVWV